MTPRKEIRAMEIKKTICDRCKKEIHNRYPKVKLWQKERRVLITKVLSDDPYDYLNTQYDLCPECIDALETWFNSSAEDTP